MGPPKREGEDDDAGRRDDIITLAKGLTNGAIPMGAVAVSRKIHDTVVEAAAPGIELFHGYTYSGHPLCAAAAIATLDLYRRDGLFARAASLAGHWETALHALRAPLIIETAQIDEIAARLARAIDEVA